jgi:hypothetical protein
MLRSYHTFQSPYQLSRRSERSLEFIDAALDHIRIRRLSWLIWAMAHLGSFSRDYLRNPTFLMQSMKILKKM